MIFPSWGKNKKCLKPPPTWILLVNNISLASMSTKNNTTLACQCLSMSKQIFRVFNNTKPCRELLISLLMFTSLLNISSSWAENTIKKNKTTKKRWVSTNTCLFFKGWWIFPWKHLFFFRGKFPPKPRINQSPASSENPQASHFTRSHPRHLGHIHGGPAPVQMGEKK